MKKSFLLIALLLASAFAFPIVPSAQAAQPLTQYTGTQCRTSQQTGFGIDLGKFTICLSKNAFSYADDWNPQSNFTIRIPTVSGFGLAATTEKNTTTLAYNLHGTVIGRTVDLTFYIKNTTNLYAKKITIAGTISGSPLSLPLVFPLSNALARTASNCDTDNLPRVCTSLTFGHLSFDWSDAFTSFSPSYNNATGLLSFTIGNSFAIDPIAIDGTAKCTSGAANTCNMTLSTTNANDIIVVISGAASAGGVGDFALAADTAALTYSNRAQICGEGFTCASVNALDGIREDYAKSSAALTNDVITCKQTGNVNSRISCLAFGVSGANFATPFDTNAAVPCTAFGTSTTPSCNVSTNNANDMIIGMTDDEPFVGQTVTAGTGYAAIISNAGDSNGDAFAEDQIVSSTQTNLAVTDTFGTSKKWVIIGDAIQQAASTVTQPITVTINQAGQMSFTYTIAGCAVTPTSGTASSAGTKTSFTANPSCTLTLTVDADTVTFQHRWRSTIATTVTVATCASGTCTDPLITVDAQYLLTDSSALSYTCVQSGATSATLTSNQFCDTSGAITVTASYTCTYTLNNASSIYQFTPSGLQIFTAGASTNLADYTTGQAGIRIDFTETGHVILCNPSNSGLLTNQVFTNGALTSFTGSTPSFDFVGSSANEVGFLKPVGGGGCAPNDIYCQRGVASPADLTPYMIGAAFLVLIIVIAVVIREQGLELNFKT